MADPVNARVAYELQPLCCAGDEASATLYWRSTSTPLWKTDGDLITASRDCLLNGDTFFASFYETWWRTYANVTELFFNFRLSGSVRLSLIRRDKNGIEQSVHEADCKANGELVSIPVPALASTSSRLIPRFKITSDVANLSEIAWATTQAPYRMVKLGAIICTFNREADLTAILANLAPLTQDGTIAAIHIVNNGDPALNEKIWQTFPKLPIKIHQQENTGGSGGFARGMMEAAGEGGSTHFLLLDDDIRVDPAIIRRMPILLGYLKQDTAIGGAMLDRLRPTELHNNVTQFNAALHKVEPAIANGDLTPPSRLDLFTHPYPADFCGWWCCAMPVAAIAKTGLPLPFFIHYDDAEYGLRLAAAGVASLSWPGLAIWHEPFYVKHSAWRRYYDFRNVLFVLVTHGKFDKKAARRELLWRFRINIQKHDYAAAWATLQAATDFLAGPGILAQWNAASHQRLIAATAAWATNQTAKHDWQKKLWLYVAFSRLYPAFFVAIKWSRQDLLALATPAFWRRKLGLG